MKRHLRRFGWLYLTLFAVVAWPIFLIRQQAAPPLDIPSVRRLVEAIQTDFAHQHPELKVRALDGDLVFKELGTENAQMGLDNRLIDLIAGGAAATAVMKPDLERAARRLEQRMKNLDALSSSGVVFTHLLPPPGKKEPATIINVEQQVPNYLTLTSIAKLRRVQAEAAMREGRWDEALRLLESSARSGNSIRYSGLIGLLIDLSTRSIAYGGYDTLLHSGVPPEVERAALDSLVRLRKTDPVFDEWSWLGERIFSLNYLIYLSETKPRERKDPASRGLSPESLMQLGMMNAAATLALQKNRIKDPALRARAEALFKDQTEMDLKYGVMKDTRPEQIKWTTIPATRKWLQEMLRREPWVREEIFSHEFKVLPASVTAKLDPWTAFLLSQGGLTPNLVEANTRSQVAKTRGRLMEAAFAARLFKEKNGVWPKDVKDLAGLYPMNEDRTTSSGIRGMWFDTRAFTPLRIAELPMTDELQTALWADVLPMRNMNTRPTDGLLKGLRYINFIQSGPGVDWVKEPVRISAVEEALRAHPALVKNIQAYCSASYIPQESDKILTPKEAREITDATDAGQRQNLPLSVRLNAQLSAPEKAVVIWSPGPDGKDDGGQICYDPTNGTTSAGDLLVFPEKF